MPTTAATTSLVSPARSVVVSPSSPSSELTPSPVDCRPLHPHSHRSRFVPNQECHLLRTLLSLPRSNESRAHSVLPSQPDAPKGTSELLLARVIDEMRAEGKNGLTFGTSSRDTLVPEANLAGWRVKMMKKGYKMINKKAGLSKRAEFRVSSRPSCPQVVDADSTSSAGQVRVGAGAPLRLLPSSWIRLVGRSRSDEDDARLVDTHMDPLLSYPRSRTTKGGGGAAVLLSQYTPT